jgi:hypothetical protein
VADLVEPVEADQDDDESVEVVEVVDFDAVDFEAVDFDDPEAVVVVAAPAAMHAPSVAVAMTLATPASTRDLAAGRRRRDRSGLGDGRCSLMRSIIRIGGKWPAKQL